MLMFCYCNSFFESKLKIIFNILNPECLKKYLDNLNIKKPANFLAGFFVFNIIKK